MYHYVRDLRNSRYPDIKGLDIDLFKEQVDYMRKNYNIITTCFNNYKIITKKLQHASKMAIVEDKPIMLDYWTSSADKGVLIGVRENGETSPHAPFSQRGDGKELEVILLNTAQKSPQKRTEDDFEEKGAGHPAQGQPI